jgi:hypothetical protein
MTDRGREVDHSAGSSRRPNKAAARSRVQIGSRGQDWASLPPKIQVETSRAFVALHIKAPNKNASILGDSPDCNCRNQSNLAQ